MRGFGRSGPAGNRGPRSSPLWYRLGSTKWRTFLPRPPRLPAASVPGRPRWFIARGWSGMAPRPMRQLNFPWRDRRMTTKPETLNAVARNNKNAQYDLLTAALIGAAVGVSATLLLRGSTRTRRVFDPALK